MNQETEHLSESQLLKRVVLFPSSFKSATEAGIALAREARALDKHAPNGFFFAAIPKSAIHRNRLLADVLNRQQRSVRLEPFSA